MASSDKKRSGSGNFPPNPHQWGAERNGLGFRSRFNLRLDEPLRPFTRELPNATVLATRGELGLFISQPLLVGLFGVHRKKWSAITIPCDGEFIVIMNDSEHHPSPDLASAFQGYGASVILWSERDRHAQQLAA